MECWIRFKARKSDQSEEKQANQTNEENRRTNEEIRGPLVTSGHYCFVMNVLSSVLIVYVSIKRRSRSVRSQQQARLGRSFPLGNVCF